MQLAAALPACFSLFGFCRAREHRYQSAGQMGLVTDGASGEVSLDESGGDDAVTVADVEPRRVQGVGV